MDPFRTWIILTKWEWWSLSRYASREGPQFFVALQFQATWTSLWASLIALWDFGKSILIWPFWLGWVDKQVGFLAGFLAVDCLNNKWHSDKHVRHLISRFWRHATFWPKTQANKGKKIEVICSKFDPFRWWLWLEIITVPKLGRHSNHPRYLSIDLSIDLSIYLSIYECIWVCPTCTVQPSYSSTYFI